MHSSTITRAHTHTKVDIRRVVECFAADLAMLASRTAGMSQEDAKKLAHDVMLMAVSDCLSGVHIQLDDGCGNVVAAHEYKVRDSESQKSPVYGSSDYPGGNNWPRMLNGRLVVIVLYADLEVAERLKSSGRLLINWSATDRLINYAGAGMRGEEGRRYSSNSYAWDRTSYVAA